jgi:hypothetical protein
MRNPFPMAKCFNDQRPLINENKCENSMTLFYMLALQNRLNMKRKFKKVMINNSHQYQQNIHPPLTPVILFNTKSGADPGFQVRGGALKKIFGGTSCEKSQFYANKSYFFQLWREA